MQTTIKQQRYCNALYHPPSLINIEHAPTPSEWLAFTWHISVGPLYITCCILQSWYTVRYWLFTVRYGAKLIVIGHIHACPSYFNPCVFFPPCMQAPRHWTSNYIKSLHSSNQPFIFDTSSIYITIFRNSSSTFIVLWTVKLTDLSIALL